MATLKVCAAMGVRSYTHDGRCFEVFSRSILASMKCSRSMLSCRASLRSIKIIEMGLRP